jgi:co-chaperonin GroES (HSP10)
MRQIKPIGEQIIIRTLPPDRVGSIIIPDSAKRITHQGEDQSPLAGSEELQYVNRWLFEDMTETMKRFVAGMYATSAGFSMNLTDEEQELLSDLVVRAEKAILPKTEKGILPSAGAGIHFVEAEVVAVGTGVRAKDPGLFDELVQGLESIFDPEDGNTKRCDPEHPKLSKLLARARNGHRVSFLVKVGDRILYHPSVQKFDRQIPPEWIGLEPGEGDVFIIREESVLAIIDREEEEEHQRSATRTASASCVSEVS